MGGRRGREQGWLSEKVGRERVMGDDRGGRWGGREGGLVGMLLHEGREEVVESAEEVGREGEVGEVARGRREGVGDVGVCRGGRKGRGGGGKLLEEKREGGGGGEGEADEKGGL